MMVSTDSEHLRSASVDAFAKLGGSVPQRVARAAAHTSGRSRELTARHFVGYGVGRRPHGPWPHPTYLEMASAVWSQ